MRVGWGLGLLASWPTLAAAEPPAAAAEQALKRRHAAPITIELPIDWVEALAERQSVRLPAAAQLKVEAARLPVLLPSTDALTDDAFVTLGDGWYSAALRGDGVHLELRGHARTHLRSDLAGAQVAAGAGSGAPRVSKTHAIFTLTFERFGVAYALDLECASHTDPRCADPGFLLAVYEGLVVAGGRP